MTILVVDDIRLTAEAVAALLKSKTGIYVYAESDPLKALAYAESHYLTVVVLDEKMPQLKGTELWAQMRRLHPETSAVMLTQERSAEAAQSAVRLGYSAHLWKNQIAELPQMVLDLHIRSVADEAKTSDARPQRLWRRRSVFKCRPELWLISRTVINDRWVDDEWRDYASIGSGQTIKFTQSLKSVTEYQYESENTASISSSLGAALPTVDIRSKLDSSLQARTRSLLSRSHQEERSLEVTYTLPAGETNAAGARLRTRTYEYAQVYLRERMVLELRCPDCGTRAADAVVVRFPIDLVAQRQVDFYEDNTTNTVGGGFRRPVLPGAA
jgi:CheY-like chemotaxis protein